MALCLCPSHLISVPIPCLECVHASAHVFMSTQLPMLAQPPWTVTWKHGFLCVALCVCPSHLTAPPPMYSYVEIWVPLCNTVCVVFILPLVPHLG